MKYRIFAAFILSAFVLSLGGSTYADLRKRNRAKGLDLVSMLPASDGVIIFDGKRAFGEALPRVLAGNQPLFSKVTSHIEEFRTRTGIDIRQFDAVAVGVAARQVAAKKYDVDPLVVARGQMGSAALIGGAKLAANGKYREETVGGRTIYIFDLEKAAPQAVQVTNGNARMEVAAAALDDRTLAFGDLARVRATLERTTNVEPLLVTMLQKDPMAVGSFAAKLPTGLKAFLPLENDELGQNIDSIQYIYGSTNVGPTSATFRATARTLQNAQATSLHQTLSGLQVFGGSLLAGSKSTKNQLFARVLESLKVSVKANEVTLDLTVPQSDLDALVGLIK